MFEPVHVERLIRHLVRFGSSRVDAEDLAQEALVIAWRKQNDLDRDRSLDAWLYGIARNVYRNHTRTLRRRAEEPAAADANGPAADARELADSVALRDALHALPENQQDIVILHELEEYTLKETAELLAIPFDTAKDRLRRAREVLRERMHVDLAVAAATERHATNRIAKAAAPAVLAGVLAALPRSAAAAAGAGAAAGASKAVLLTGVLAVGIAVGVVADRVIASRPSSAVAPRAAVSASAPDAPAREAVSVSAPEVSPQLATPDAGVGTTVAVDHASPDADVASADAGVASPPAPGVNPEAQLVERARIALRRGRADDAVRTLMAHERRFPRGQLAEERDVLLVEAYLASGNLRLADERLQHYRATYPSGIHRARANDAAREIEQRRAP